MGYFSENYAHGAKFKANGIGLPFANLKDVVKLLKNYPVIALIAV